MYIHEGTGVKTQISLGCCLFLGGDYLAVYALFTVCVMCLVVAVPWVGLRSVTVAFPGPAVIKFVHAQLNWV